MQRTRHPEERLATKDLRFPGLGQVQVSDRRETSFLPKSPNPKILRRESLLRMTFAHARPNRLLRMAVAHARPVSSVTVMFPAPRGADP